MTAETKPLPNLYQRINAVRKAIGYIQKEPLGLHRRRRLQGRQPRRRDRHAA